MQKALLSIILLSFLSACAVFSNKDSVGQFPIYGNWCGPAHPKKGTNPKPIDKTDQACKNHDICYEKNGYLNKKCDKQLIADLKSFRPDDKIEQFARKAILSYFKKSPKL
jgi:hypothetical protein